MRERLRAGVKRFIRRLACHCVGNRIYSQLWFRLRHGYWPDLSHPRSFNERMLWITLNSNLEDLAPYVDKFEVRKYVADCAGSGYLVPLVGVYEDLNAVDWQALPRSFVAKATDGSRRVLVVNDKAKADKSAVEDILAKWLERSFYAITGEKVYKHVRPRILIEQMLSDPSGDLKDFKFLCVWGEPRFIDVHGQRFADHREDVLDMSWRKLPCMWGKVKHFSEPVERPRGAEEMLDLCRKLARRFPFVRVDLYCISDRPYFGELTFVPANGREVFAPREFDYVLGHDIPLVKDYLADHAVAAQP